MTDARPVRDFMTACPHVLEPTQSVAAAGDLMRQQRIRHVPVVDGGRLCGLVSERDVTLVLSLVDVDPKTVRVRDVMASETYTVSPSTPLRDVAAEMAASKAGSAVVVTEGGEVVGIFTTIDALRALEEMLEGAVR